MKRDKTKDNDFFDWSKECELIYLSELYVEKKIVYKALKYWHEISLTKKIKHKHLFILIESIMGYQVPD